MDYLIQKELAEAKDEKNSINEELAAQQKKFANQMLNGFGEYMNKNINTLATLTKSEKKMIRKQKKNHFFNNIKKLFMGENDTEI